MGVAPGEAGRVGFDGRSGAWRSAAAIQWFACLLWAGRCPRGRVGFDGRSGVWRSATARGGWARLGMGPFGGLNKTKIFTLRLEETDGDGGDGGDRGDGGMGWARSNCGGLI